MEVSGIWNIHDSVKLCGDEDCHADENHAHLESLPHSSCIHSASIHPPVVKSLSEPSQPTNSIQHHNKDEASNSSETGQESGSGSGFSDLDLLPTKETSFPSDDFGQSSSSCTSHLSSSSNTPLHSPYHENRTMHSDTEITPRRICSSNSENFHRKRYVSENSETLDDALPPQLQKLLDAALAEIEQRQCTETRNTASNCHSSQKSNEKEADLNC